MVACQLERDAADQIFAALTDATRRDIVTRVLRGEASVAALAGRYDITFAAIATRRLGRLHSRSPGLPT